MTMADDQKNLDILIRTKAELGGAQALEQQLERDIGKAKALGNIEELAKLTPQLATVRAAIGSAQVGQEDLTGAMDKGAEAAEKSHISHGALHKLFREIGNNTAPMLGHALTAALYGPIGLAIALGSAVEGVKSAFEAEAQAAEDFQAAIESGADVESMSKAAGEFQAAVASSAVAADEFERAMGKIKSGQTDIKTETDAAVAALHAESQAWAAVQKSRTDAARADIRADAAAGKISKEEEIRRIAELEGRAAQEKTQKSAADRAKELELRKQELVKTAAAAAVAEAAVPAAQDAAEKDKIKVKRREKLAEEIRERIKAAEEQNAKLLEQIGPLDFSDNSKTSGTSKLPGAHSAEAIRYQTGKAQIEANEEMIPNLKRQLGRLSNTPSVVANERSAAKTADEEKEAVENAKRLAARVKELEKEVAEKTASNALADATDAAVAGNEQHARATDAGSQIHTELTGRMRRDVETIQNYEKEATINPQELAKAGAAIRDLQAMLAQNADLLNDLAGLGSSVKDLGHAQSKLAAETALARQIAQQALENSNLH